MCRLCPIWIGCQRCLPKKEELGGRGSNSISSFQHHNILIEARSTIHDVTGMSRIRAIYNRYLMSRFTLQGFYLWRHVLSTATPLILWWLNLEIIFIPLHRSCGAALSTNLKRTHSLYCYLAERTLKAANVRSLCSVQSTHGVDMQNS
jgi:hypothetical protein